MSQDSTELYDAAFYADQARESLESALAILPRLFAAYRPTSVIDVGCGVGPWLAAAQRLGVAEGIGVDGDYVPRHALLVPESAFRPHDLAAAGLVEGVLAAREGRRFDLAISVEVAEHLPFDEAGRFVGDLCALSDAVLFCAALPFQHGTGHINEQWPEFWAMHFRAQGYLCFDLLRAAAWADPSVRWWYAQNLLVFARAGSAAAAAFAAADPPATGCLTRVHPEAWLSSTLNLWRPYRAAARVEEPADLRAVQAAWLSGAAQPPEPTAVARAKAASPESRDVFPYTRTEVADVEAMIAALQLAATAQAGQSAEHDTTQAEIETLRQQLAAAQRRAEALSAERDATQTETERLRTVLGDTTAAKAALSKQLAITQAANATLQSQLGRLHQTLSTLRETTQDIQTLRDRLAAQHIEAEQLRAGLAQRQAMIEALLSSTSWRITGPLRLAGSMIRKRRGVDEG
jgi:SAM-dependent methyltransferase/regulator of replication initiation timing